MSMSRVADRNTAKNAETSPDSDRPYGTEKRRPLYPLILLGVAFVCWFAFLIVLAVREAALT
jgi:hypothetical protein